VIEGDLSATFFKNKYKKISKEWSKLTAITDHNNAFSSLYTQINDEFLNKIKNSSKTSQIRINSIFANDTPGQFSFNFEAADAIRYCDNLLVFKLITKKLALDG
jgi:glutamine synthetase